MYKTKRKIYDEYNSGKTSSQEKKICVFNVCESRQRKIQQIKLILRKQLIQNYV